MTGVMKNARHEKFAQERAMGKSIDAAYAEAGFKPHRGNAARLSANESVRARVAELQGRAADKAVVTVESITERLLSIAAKGELSSDAPMLSVARASLMDAAKLNGLIVEKRDLTSSDGSMTPKEPRYVLVRKDAGNG